MTRKPLILIPVSKPPKTYLSALEAVGVNSICNFSPSELDKLSGLLLTGGGDILSSFYNCSISCNSVNVLRDATEINLFKYFFEKNAPVLAICRGMQMVNVCLGGTLKTVDGHQSPCKMDVDHNILPSNGIFKAFKETNSNHKQCIDKLCSQAENVIYSHDGVIEGFTVKNTIAVQFHPERMDLNAIHLIYGEFAKRVNLYFAKLK